jgi:hypothetical protein
MTSIESTTENQMTAQEQPINYGAAANTARQLARQTYDLQSLTKVLDLIAGNERYIADSSHRRDDAQRNLEECEAKTSEAIAACRQRVAETLRASEQQEREAAECLQGLRDRVRALELRETELQGSVAELQNSLSTLRNNARAIAG